MFWNKDKPEGRPPTSTRAPTTGRQLPPEETALDTVAELLRILGRYSFDIDDKPSAEVSADFERLARRLLLGEAARSDVETTGTLPPAPPRDFALVRRWVEGHRRQEQDYVVRALDNLRRAVREFVGCTTASLRADREGDLQMSTELDKLDRALAINDHQAIRRAAEITAHAARGQIEAHRVREQEMIIALRETINALEGELDQARRDASIDPLTKTFNRAALETHLERVADASFLSGAPSTVVMIDIDHFKVVNDSFGHPMGDEVIRRIADTIVRGFLRREDFVARYGGEEFCVVCEHATFEVTRERAERLRRSVEQMKFDSLGRSFGISVSFGIASLGNGESVQSWVTRADDALYRAKQKGRNRISIAPASDPRFPSSASPLEPERVVRGPSNLVGQSCAPEESNSASDDPGPPGPTSGARGAGRESYGLSGPSLARPLAAPLK